VEHFRNACWCLVVVALVSCGKHRPAGATPVDARSKARVASGVDSAHHATERPVDDGERSFEGTDRVSRLVRLAKVWASIRWLHPYLFDRAVDWDGALVRVLPKIDATRSANDYAAAVEEMLAVLHDPLTHTARDDEPLAGAAEQDAAVGMVFERRDPDLVVVTRPTHVRDRSDYDALRTALLAAKNVIVDLRAPNGAGREPIAQMLKAIQDALVSHPCHAPARRRVEHFGFRTQVGSTSGGYHSVFASEPGESFTPAQGGSVKRVAFLVNENSVLFPIVLALQTVGDGVIVAQGDISEQNVSDNQNRLPLGEGWHVEMRAIELSPAGVPKVDARLPIAASTSLTVDDPATKAALALLRRGSRARAAPAAAEEPFGRSDLAYEEMHYPAKEYRLLALFRVWSAIHFFYPYQHLFDRNWDGVLAEFIPKLEAAEDATAYALALAELAAQIPDGHSLVFGSPELRTWRGDAAPPITMRMIEGQPAVVAATEVAVKAGVVVGDVVVRVDGEPADLRMKRYARYEAASNATHRSYQVVTDFLGGSRGSLAALTLRDGSGREKEVKLERGDWFWGSPTGAVVRIIDGGIGYVDLTRLLRDEVDAMFEKLRDTRAIVFDMRGYPNGTAWLIAPRINTRSARFGATFYEPLVSSSMPEGAKIYFQQSLPVDSRWKYTGRTVMLIDERTVSQAEHTGLFFEAASGTEFIGSQTAGANGDATTMLLPGGLKFRFSGHDVRHADGRQLQRIGLLPDVQVTPTLAGIRAGKDEVLDRAVDYLSH
jgi:C-terminal processing protease CtpA/Prc